MSQHEFTRAQKRKLRELADEAYARELDEELRNLEGDFADWRRGNLSGFQLSESIHEFHDGPARELWKIYVRGKPDSSVARAVANETLRRDEVPSALLDRLASHIQWYESYDDESGEDESDEDES